MVAIDITQSSNGLACWRIYAKFKQILFVESLRPIGHCLSQLVQRFANHFDLLWYVFLVGVCRGGGYFWKFEFFWVLKKFCLLVHSAVVLFVYKVAGTHHVMNTDTGWHRHAEETTKYATGVEFHKNTKADFIAMFRRGEERDVDANEEMKSEWTTFLSQLASAARTVVPAIGRPGVSYSNCLSIEHSYQTPLPHTPCLTYWITKFIEMLFSKETWFKHEMWGIQFSSTQEHV